MLSALQEESRLDYTECMTVHVKYTETGASPSCLGFSHEVLSRTMHGEAVKAETGVGATARDALKEALVLCHELQLSAILILHGLLLLSLFPTPSQTPSVSLHIITTIRFTYN